VHLVGNAGCNPDYPHVHTNNTHTRPKVPHTRHTTHNRARPHHQDIPHRESKALYTRHTAHKNTRSRVSNKTTHKDPHTSRPHHHTYKTAKDRPNEGVNRSQPQFKEREKRSSDRPSDRVDSTHTHTHPMPKRLLPSHGMKSKVTRVEQADGILNPIHPCASPHPVMASSMILYHSLSPIPPSVSRMRKAHKGTYQK
jgi:hypothetical protein